MASASPPEDYIYQGVWVNWLKGGKVFGATLTLNPSAASILSPALAVIIAIAGSQLWRLFQFALHQSRVTNQERNFLYHQQQITLRNTATDLNTLWRLIRLAFAWRRHSDVNIFRQSWPLITWTSLHLTLFIMASLFSSWLLQAGNHVLSRSPWCGTYNVTTLDRVYNGNSSNTDDVRVSFEYLNHINSRFALVQQQIDICDTTNHSCADTAINKLEHNSRVVSSHCPFGGSICHPRNESIVFDTGFLSSAAHLGFNTPSRYRISFRLLAECAPLDDAKYVSDWRLVNGTSEVPARQVSDAYYGPVPGISRNSTFQFTKQYVGCAQRALLPPYVLNSEWSQPAPSDGTFKPISELQLSDADLSLIMLMSSPLYDSPVLDPWFTAQLAANEVDIYCEGTNKTMYTRETPLTTLGCKQQWQICNTDFQLSIDDTRCTELQGINQLHRTFRSLDQSKTLYNPQQLAIVDRLFDAAWEASFFYLVYSLGKTTGAPLKARNLNSGTSGVLPPDTQWQTESKYWMDILLGYLQQNAMDYSTGQFASKTMDINATIPTSDSTGSAYSLCQSQLINSTVYRNFNFFALLVCVILCTIITILGLCIEDIIGYIRQHRSCDTSHLDKQDMWIANSDLEMFRMLIELKKKIQWGRSSFGIPFTAINEKADIGDLRSDVLEAKAGHGIVNKNVVRRQTASKDVLSPQRRRAHSHGTYVGRRSCGTCKSFETLPSSRDNSSNEPLPTISTMQRSHLDGFHFANEIPAQRAQSEIPLLQDESQQRQGPQIPRINGCDIVRTDDFTEVDAIQRLQPFHYRIGTSVPREFSTDTPDRRQDSGHSTPLHNYDDSARSHHDLLFSSDQEKDGIEGDNDNDDRVERTRGIWPWSRRNDSSGTIC